MSKYKKFLLVLLAFITSFPLFSQSDIFYKSDEEYPYMYRVGLLDSPSCFYTILENNKVKKKAKKSYNLSIRCMDNNLDYLPFVSLKLILEKDTQNLITNDSGCVNINVNLNKSKNIHIVTNIAFYNNLNIYIPLHQEIPIHVGIILGHSKINSIAEIYSKRELSQNEIYQLIDAISNNKTSMLLDDKTCYYLIEI